VRTWAPRGQTPHLLVKHTKDHLSAISGITLDGRLFLQVRAGSYDSAAVVGFLRVLLRKVRGRIVLIWDGSPIHRGQAVKDFLRRGASKRLHLEQLPGYAPDLNADEGVWNYLKRVELANVCCHALPELRAHLIRARERLRHKRTLLCACSRHCGYDLRWGDGSERDMLLRHDAAVVSVHFSHDGAQLVSATRFEGITLWEVASGTALRTHRYAASGVTDALLLPDGRHLFAADTAFGDSALVDLQMERATITYAMIQADCTAWVPPGRGILIASWDETLRGAAQLLDPDNLQIHRTYRTGMEGLIRRVAVSRDGARFLAAQQYYSDETDITSADAAFLFETDTGAILRRYDGPATLYDIVFAPDEQQVIVGGESGLWWWETQTAAVIGQLDSPSGTLTSLASAAATVGNNQLLAGGCEDGTVVVWSWPDLREICRFHDHTDCVNQVTFAPDARHIASASADATVSLRSLDK